MGEERAVQKAVLKVFFNRLGHAERVSVQFGSGSKARDALCVAYCKTLVIAVPRAGTRKAGELWRQVTISPDVAL
jgi:hypothetical protein